MAFFADRTNRHVVDKLADVRAEIAALEAVEAKLKDQIVSGIFGFVGAEHVATVYESERNVLDAKKVEAKFSPAKLAGCYVKRSYSALRVARIGRVSLPPKKR